MKNDNYDNYMMMLFIYLLLYVKMYIISMMDD